MSPLRSPAMESIISILSCTPEEYWSVYEGPSATDDLAEAVTLNVIKNCEQSLRAEKIHYKLDGLLYSMLREAPHSAGKRYVAAALHVAYTKGERTVLKLAKAWMEKLFLALLAIPTIMKAEAKAMKAEANGDSDSQPSSQRSIDSSTIQCQHPFPATVSSELGIQVLKREKHYCPITKRIEREYLFDLAAKGIFIDPDPCYGILEIAHIIPLVFSGDINQPIREAEPSLRDFFESWTQLGQHDLSQQRVNSPANAMYLSEIEHYELTTFKLYFDKQAFPDSPNKYMVQRSNPKRGLSIGVRSTVAEFPSFEESGVEPPDPTFLHVHASLSAVLFESGASYYYDRVDPADAGKIDPAMLNTPEVIAFLKEKKLLNQSK